MERSADSHKGENGKVAVVGGSAFMHGAPIFSGIAAEASGVDLIFVALPERHAGIARAASLNFQVHPFVGDDLTKKDVAQILELLATVDCAVIGPGLSRDVVSLKQLRELIAAAPCPLVLDASALQPWTLEAVRGKIAVLTPHLGELERMEMDPEMIGDVAKENAIVIHAKGRVDRIATADGSVTEVEGGNAGLTVGGTGDALAGLIAGLMAQGVPPATACERASRAIKDAGDALFAKNGFSYTTQQVIDHLPSLLAKQS